MRKAINWIWISIFGDDVKGFYVKYFNGNADSNFQEFPERILN